MLLYPKYAAAFSESLIRLEGDPPPVPPVSKMRTLMSKCESIFKSLRRNVASLSPNLYSFILAFKQVIAAPLRLSYPKLFVDAKPAGLKLDAKDTIKLIQRDTAKSPMHTTTTTASRINNTPERTTVPLITPQRGLCTVPLMLVFGPTCYLYHDQEQIPPSTQQLSRNPRRLRNKDSAKPGKALKRKQCKRCRPYGYRERRATPAPYRWPSWP